MHGESLRILCVDALSPTHIWSSTARRAQLATIPTARVSGGFLPPKARGTRMEHFMHMADWFATFAFLAGASADDPNAASSGLPPPDSVNAWAHITGDPTAAGPLRPLMQLSSNTIVNCTDGHKLVVSMCERENKTQGLLRCDVTGMNIWSPAVYPNASQPDGGGGDALDAANCTTGCLW